MTAAPHPDTIPAGNRDVLRTIQRAILSSVRDASDLSARQLSLLLRLTLDPSPHTIRGSAAILGTSRPAMTRAMDALETLKLGKRLPDRQDGRNVLLTATAAGFAYVERMRLAGEGQG